MGDWLLGGQARRSRRGQSRIKDSKSDAGILTSPRARLRLALVFSVVIIALLSFGVFPSKRHSITADGRSVAVLSRESNASALLELAGVNPQVGDIVFQSESGLLVERAISVLVGVDGQTLAWRTRAASVGELLDEMGLSVSPYDGVVYNGVDVRLSEFLVPEEKISISINRAVALTVKIDGRPIGLQSSRSTLDLALRDAGITLGPADKIYPSPEAPIVAGMEVQIEYAKAVSLQTGEATHVLYTHAESLLEALAEIGLVLEGDDRVEPGPSTLVTNGMSARLVRVAGQNFVERTSVLRQTVFKPDETLSGSETRRVVGSDGVLVMEYTIVIEDGVETERTLVGQSFNPEPVNTVIYYAASAAEASGITAGELNVTSVKEMWATWYNAASSGKPNTHPAYGITFSGVPLARGIVAVDPDVIPLGTRLYIPGYGFALALDTGGGIIGDMIDLGYPDGVDVDWHTGWADVYILGP